MRSIHREKPRSILIVKLSAIGDVVQTLPMLEALRGKFPGARIDWLVEEEASELIIGHPALNRVIVSRRKFWQRKIFRRGGFTSTIREIGKFLRDLRNREYDWVIDNHGLLKSGLLVMLSRGRRKIGFKRSRGIAEEGSYLFTNERYTPLSLERHALERYLDLIAQMGVPVDRPTLNYTVAEEARLKAEALLTQNGLASRPIIVIHPMAKWPTKQWPRENFVRLARTLTEQGASVIFTGSSADFAAIERITHSVPMSGRLLNLAGQTSLKELAALFFLSDLVLSTDTGPMHLAAAVKAPLLALFGPTAPWRTGPYGDGHVVLRKALTCSPCFRKKCPTMECMKSLAVEEVLSAAIEKLSQGKKAGFAESRVGGEDERGDDCFSHKTTCPPGSSNP